MPSDLVEALKVAIPSELASDLVNEFISIKYDVITQTLGKATPGKFAETIVQILQYISTGEYSKTFKTGEIEDFLKNTEARSVDLSQDLKIVMTRIVRGIYTLRNKRGITHKSGIDPNIYDLRYLYAAAQWVMSEMMRYVISSDMDTAGRLIEFIQLPASLIVEDFGERRLVLKSCTAKEEAIILLLHYYPNFILTSQLHKDMNRRPSSTVSNTISSLYRGKLIDGNKQSGYKLTVLGYSTGSTLVQRLSGE